MFWLRLMCVTVFLSVFLCGVSLGAKDWDSLAVYSVTTMIAFGCVLLEFGEPAP